MLSGCEPTATSHQNWAHKKKRIHFAPLHRVAGLLRMLQSMTKYACHIAGIWMNVEWPGHIHLIAYANSFVPDALFFRSAFVDLIN